MYVLFFFKKRGEKILKMYFKVSVNLYLNFYLLFFEFLWYFIICDFFVILNIKCNCM